MHGPPHKGGVSWKLSHNEESLWEIWNAKGRGGGRTSRVSIPSRRREIKRRSGVTRVFSFFFFSFFVLFYFVMFYDNAMTQLWFKFPKRDQNEKPWGRRIHRYTWRIARVWDGVEKVWPTSLERSLPTCNWDCYQWFSGDSCHFSRCWKERTKRVKWSRIKVGTIILYDSVCKRTTVF